MDQRNVIKKERYLLIEPEGKMRWISVDPERYVKQFQEAIGCRCIEPVRTVLPGVLMLVDEEFLCKNPVPSMNRIGCRLYRGYLEAGHPILGNVIIGGEGFRNGEPDIVPLAAAQCGVLSRYIGYFVQDFVPEVLVDETT